MQINGSVLGGVVSSAPPPLAQLSTCAMTEDPAKKIKLSSFKVSVNTVTLMLRASPFLAICAFLQPPAVLYAGLADVFVLVGGVGWNFRGVSGSPLPEVKLILCL